MFILLRKIFLLLPLAIFCLAIRPDALNLQPAPGRMRTLPSRTLWVWERPEDLRSLDPQTTAIATLDATLLLGNGINVLPRRQFYAAPQGIRRIAVIRIEAPGKIAPDLASATADRILSLALAPNIVALQIDFDARLSQRRFYNSLLRLLRRRMPANLPLSITALASWCSNDDWIANLPVDEAVPMFFRMEPGRRTAPQQAPELRIREPLCTGSIGISTHEPAPAALTGKRLYIFADRGWHQDLSLLANPAFPTHAFPQRTQP